MSSPVLMVKLAVFTKVATGPHSFSVKSTASFGPSLSSDVLVYMLGSVGECVPEFGYWHYAWSVCQKCSGLSSACRGVTADGSVACPQPVEV